MAGGERTAGRTVTAFKEHKEFAGARLCDVHRMTFPQDTVTPPHYADTLEILLCRNLKGTAVIDGNAYPLAGTQAFYIAPNVVHSVYYRKNDGDVRVVKVNLERMRAVMDFEEILRRSGRMPENVPQVLPPSEELDRIAEAYRRNDSLTAVLEATLQLLRQLVACTPPQTQPVSADRQAQLRQVIDWTERNFSRKITLEEAAAQVGYDKHYFCWKFKAVTGITYVNYVNQLRIDRACALLRGGMDVRQAGEQCGIENDSYFSALFKRIMGVTPKQYRLQSAAFPENGR